MIWCGAAEVTFLPLAQPRVLPQLPSETERLSTYYGLEASDAQITAQVTIFIKRYKIHSTSNKL